MSARSERTEDLLTVSEAARILGLSANTVRTMLRRGDLPSLNTPQGVRVSARAVQEHIEAAQVAPGALAHLYVAAVPMERRRRSAAGRTTQLDAGPRPGGEG